MYRVIASLLTVLFLTACNTTGGSTDDLFSSVVDGLDNSGKPAPGVGGGSSRTILSNNGGNSFKGATQQGTGQFVSGRAPMVVAETTAKGGEGYRLNLVNAPIAAAAKDILGDILNLNYTINPNVQGAVTLQTSEPVSRDTLIDVFETTLAANGMSIVRSAGVYRIVTASEALGNSPAVSVPSVTGKGPGIKIQVVQLQYISAEEMRNILAPISREGSILRVDSERNYIMIAGNNPDLSAMIEAVGVFDVDWMRGMSVAIHPLEATRAADIAKELETIFRTQDGPGNKLIRFVPNERLNSVLVITSRPAYLARAESWIKKLDQLARTNETQLFVYEIQNRPADELAKVLQKVLTDGGPGKGGLGSSDSASNAVSPDLREVEISSDGGQVGGSEDTSISAPGVSVVADMENNALLISASGREYARIQSILKQLDVLPTQVLLEAVIAEVSLNDELKFGVRWFFEKDHVSVGLSDLVSGFTGASFPGLAWSFAAAGIEATLNTLSSVTDVKVISSPSIMALNNQKAILQIGDQVPIVTQQSTATGSAGAPVINTVELKDTGIILTVTPRVNASGRVLLDIEQEASNVVRTTTSGIDSPTIQQRKVSTRVVVNDNEALVLGGLIQERNTNSRGQVPVLGEFPILGNLFKNKTDTISRTELLIFIRPRVVRNFEEARSVNEEFRRRLDFGASGNWEKRIQRDLKRLQ